MSVKEKVKTLVDAMPNNEVERLMVYISRNFRLVSVAAVDGWDFVEEAQPDEVDILMMEEMENNPDCGDFS
ncbi:MAG: hypothetical protein FWB98_05375 [Defluviitaleaceae bacterium]|nr:hypothetical protein [Defluviitaleaceae bacterium]